MGVREKKGEGQPQLPELETGDDETPLEDVGLEKAMKIIKTEVRANTLTVGQTGIQRNFFLS